MTSSIEIILVIFFLIALDQCTKVFISKNNVRKIGFSEIGISSFLNIVFVRNTGISFGMFSEGGLIGRYFFSTFSIVVGVFLILLAILSDKKILNLGLGLIASGAIGNAIDRVYFGGVIDFIDLFIYNLHWPAFNFADVFIVTIGVILLLFENVFYKKK